MPLRLEVHVHLPKVVEGQSNLPRRFDPAATTVRVGVHGKQRDPDQQEVEKGFAQPALDCREEPLPQLRPCRGLRLSNYGCFIHQRPPTKEPQFMSAVNYATAVFLL